MRQSRIFVSGFLAALLLTLAGCGGSQPTAPAKGSETKATDTKPASGKTVVIWWNKGYYPEEDEAMKRIVAEWEKASGYKAELSFYSTEDIPKKILSAIEAGNPPDVAFAHVADWQLNPRLAWENKLADVSDVIEPIKNSYTDGALKSVYLYNNVAKKRSYYAIPIEQQTIHIFYWRDILKEIGKDEKQIPKDWNGFWNFWKQVQNELRKQGKKISGMGIPMSTGASDTYYIFEQILEAYGVRLLDDDGKLLVDQPGVRDGIATVLKFYKDIAEFNPSGAVNWQDPDNNANFLNRTTVMTPNPTLSIPAAKKADQDLYFNKIGTSEWPDRPDGKPITYLVSVKTALVPASAKNQEGAKDFLRYLLKPERLGEYVKGSLGRWFPVMPESLKDPFWTDPKDPHISVAVRQFTQRPTRPFYMVQNPAYGQVLSENVWGKAIGRVVIDGVAPEKAADEAIARIKAIFAEWK